MSLRGRFFSDRDVKLIHSINHEFLDDIIQSMVTIFKINAEASETNIYGEVDPNKGKVYFPGIDITCRIKKDAITTKTEDYGTTRSQDVSYIFLEKDLRTVNFFPEIGDIIFFNERYYEVDNVVQEQFLGDVEDKSFSIVCHTHYSRISSVNIVSRQT